MAYRVKVNLFLLPVSGIIQGINGDGSNEDGKAKKRGELLVVVK